MTGRQGQALPLRAGWWAALLPLVFATALPGAQAQLTGSRLVSPQSESSRPPNIGPMYRTDAIVTGTDMRQRPWGFAQTLREVLVKLSGDPRLKDDPRTAGPAADAARAERDLIVERLIH